MNLTKTFSFLSILSNFEYNFVVIDTFYNSKILLYLVYYYKIENLRKRKETLWKLLIITEILIAINHLQNLNLNIFFTIFNFTIIN